MAVIDRYEKKDGDFTYKVTIRRKGYYERKTFLNEDDTMAYAYYKENLIQSKESFGVGIQDTLSIQEAFDLKMATLDSKAPREKKDYAVSKARIDEYCKKYPSFNPTLSMMRS